MLAHMLFRDGAREPRVERAAEQGLARISRGIYLNWPSLVRDVSTEMPFWQAQQIVNKARLHAATRRFGRKRPIVFTGTSALVAAGRPHWVYNPPVTYRALGSDASVSRLFPAVRTPVGTVQAVRAVSLGGRTNIHSLKQNCVFDGPLPSAPLHVVAADLVRTQTLMGAYVDTCMLLMDESHGGASRDPWRSADLCNETITGILTAAAIRKGH